MGAAEPTSPYTMRCLEVWGGNHAVDNGVVMAGLDAWLYSRPFRDQSTGGDIHFVSSCAAGMVTRVLVADVSGHGDAVADAASKLRGLMRRYVNFIDQGRLISGLNTEFGAIAQAGGFATAIVATFEASTDSFTLCKAGHPRPLWYRRRTGTWSLMDEARARADTLSNVPLGIAEPTCYDQSVVRLATGDLVVLYTDSLIEAKGSDGGALGQEGLLEVVRKLDPEDPADLLRGMRDAVAKDDAGAPSGDDVTILILRPNGLKPRSSALTELKAAGRMLAAAVSSLRPGGPPFPWPDIGALGSLGAALNRTKRG
jgi:hypothetical protein